MESWWQSWGELIARRLALRGQSRRQGGNAAAAAPTDHRGSEPARTEDEEVGGDEGSTDASGESK